MFCVNCGSKNSDEAIYCQKCGNLLEAEEQTRVARKIPAENFTNFTKENDLSNQSEDERRIFTVSPTLMFVKIGYATAVFGAIFLVAVLSVLYDYLKIPAWISVLIGLSMLLIPAFYHFRQKLVRYTLTDAKIEIDEGLISRTTRNIPLHTIQDVTVSATVTQRMLGFGNLIIENANESDGKIILQNINSPKKYADILLKQMRRVTALPSNK